MADERLVLVNSDQWRGTPLDLRPEQIAFLVLLDQDIESAQIALEDYKDNRRRLVGVVPRIINARIFTAAKAFVTVMRRLERLFTAAAARQVFAPDVLRKVKQPLRDVRALLETYIPARDVIEHIDGEVDPKTSLALFNLERGDELVAIPGVRAKISREALEKVIRTRDELVRAVVDAYRVHTGP